MPASPTAPSPMSTSPSRRRSRPSTTLRKNCPATPARRRRQQRPDRPAADLRRTAHPAPGERIMTSRPLRLSRPGELPAPRADDDSATVLAQAVDTLAALRTPYWLGDSAVGLHALASLIAQAQQMIPEAVTRARDQDHTWAEIGQLLNLSPQAAARRYRNR